MLRAFVTLLLLAAPFTGAAAAEEKGARKTAPGSAPQQPPQDLSLADLGPAVPKAELAAPPPPAAPPPVDDDPRFDKHGFYAGLRLGVLVPSGRPASAASGAGDTQPWAHRAATLPVMLQLGYRLPWLGRNLAVSVEGGWYPLSSSGTRSFPQDPDFPTLTYSWSATQIPLFAGLEYRLPLLLPAPFSRFTAWGGASFAAVHTQVTAVYLSENVTDAPQSGWALGFSLGLGAGFRIGPGLITADFRFVNARTDLRLRSLYPGQPWNAEKGDVQGANYLVGYRLFL